VTSRKVLSQQHLAATFRLSAVVTVLVAACGDQTPPSSAVARTGSGLAERCDMTPIDDKGTLPACAAGTTTKAGPGLPYNFVGVVRESDVDITPDAMPQAGGITAKDSTPSDPVDNGFAPTASNQEGQGLK
jgi:hypothetical protein